MTATPLNDDEYDTLDDLLADMGAQAMDVAKLEGYLTALVAGPAEPALEVWLPQVWGGGAGNEEAAGLVLRHHAYMRTWLAKDPGSFEPIYECGGTWTVDAWCEGFQAGMLLNADAWAPLRASQPALLVPLQRPANASKVAASVSERKASSRVAPRTVRSRKGMPERTSATRNASESETT